MNPTPSFVVLLGFPRSGTTLLSRLLDAHPEISCPPETHLLSAASRFLSEQTEVEKSQKFFHNKSSQNLECTH